jgi:hypothetical protein
MYCTENFCFCVIIYFMSPEDFSLDIRQHIVTIFLLLFGIIS